MSPGFLPGSLGKQTFELNSFNTSSLPYIEISKPPLKLLIDSGASSSMIRPDIIEKYFPSCIYQQETKLKNFIGEQKTQYKAKIPAFPEFNTNKLIDVVLFNFHDYFDGLIGLETIKNLKLNIDFSNDTISNENSSIPIKMKTNTPSLKTIRINPKEIIKTQIPIDSSSSEVYITETEFNNLMIPPTITKIEEGYALVEIHNYTNNPITHHFTRPLQAKPLETYQVEKPKLTYDPTNAPDTTIRTNHMNKEEKTKILNLIQKYSHLLHADSQPLDSTNTVQHEIKTKDETPIYSKIYRLPKIHQQEVARQINDLLDKGIIRPSSSPWAAPVLIVDKKLDASGKRKFRMCIDYRNLNANTIDDRYPLPNITELLDKLGRCQYFSTLDLASGFHQIKVHPNSIHKTAFSTNEGHFEYLRMPFGLKNAPATFQRLMNNILRDEINKNCAVYMDDIIIFSPTLDEHIKHLESVFKKLDQANLRIQIDKSEFLRKETEFLGHVITPDGIRPNQKKIEAIQNFKLPSTQKEIKSFLGLVGYYRKFIDSFAAITKPLTNCLKKGKTITHTESFKKAFQTCKDLITNAPILRYPDFNKTFELTTDASNYAIGAVLSQEGKPIAYASRTLNPAETRYSTIEKELLAVVFGTKYFRPYLYGQKFIIYTDHKPLQWIFSLKDPASRLVRWRLKLSEYDYEVRYKKGSENSVADALSRLPQMNELHAIEQDDNTSMINNPPETLTDDELQELCNETLKNLQTLNDMVTPTTEEPPNDDNETAHTSTENPTNAIKITQRPINMYQNQIIFNADKTLPLQVQVENKKVFPNNQRTIMIFHPETPSCEITEALKASLLPDKTNCLFFFNESIVPRITNILSSTFIPLQIVKSNIYLRDITDPEIQTELIKNTHESNHRGHNETIKQLQMYYYWPNLTNDAKNFINQCPTCNINKYDRNPQKPLFQKTPTPLTPFEIIHMDLFMFDKDTPVLTIIDTFSKFVQAYILEHKNSIAIKEKLLQYLSIFGTPNIVIHDPGSEFKNATVSDLLNNLKISIHETSIGTSTGNSSIERFHSTLIEHLRNLKEKYPTATKQDILNKAIILYNNSIHSTTNLTPNSIIFPTRNMRTNENTIINDYLKRDKILRDLINNELSKRLENEKVKRLDKLNQSRKEPEKLNDSDLITIQHRRVRPKKLDKPFMNALVTGDQEVTVNTNKGKYHKRKVKKKGKYYGQKTADDPNNPSPSTSK